MDTELSSIPIEPYSDSTRPSTGSSFYSGITSPSGSSEDEFFDAPESLGSHGHTREDSVSEPRISTPLVSTDILPILHPDEIPHNPPSIPNVSDSVIPLPTTISVLDQFNRANVPLKEEDFSSLESLENPSETETVTASFNQRWTSSPNIETYPITEERVIPGFNGTTTNILTFLSPNSDSANKEFTFKPIEQPTNCEFSQDPNLTPPLPESELLDETLQNRPLTPDLPPPPSLILAGNITQGQMEHTQSNPQKLYPELDTLSPPPPLWDQKETLSQLPQFPLTPPSPPPAEYFLTPSDRQPVPIPEMEHNPLFVPDPTPSPLKTELLMLGSVPPAAASLVMNPLNQIILAQQQALSQHFSANIPHIPLTQQIHPNYLTAFQNYSSQNHYNLSPGAFGNISEVQSNLNGNDDDCIAEWKRDLILKEKRILKDKFGDNYVNIVTESYPIIQPPQFQCDPEEIENMFPAPPYPQSPSEFHSIQTNGDSTEDISTVQRCEEDQTPLPDRISYPSLNSSDEDSVPININQQIKNEHILPGFISRMKDRNSPQMISQDWVIPPSEAGYISPIPIPMTYYDIQAQTSTLFQEDIPSLQQQTIRYDNTQFVVKDKPIHRTQTELVPRSDRAILYPPVEHPPTHQLPTGPMIKPPSYDTTPPREIKRPPGDTSSLNSTPSPYKPANREISYPPGLESSVSPKKQVIYPPSSTKKICYPPSKEILRPPVSLNKTCVSNSNNDISYSAEREILYPHSWTEAPPSSPSSSPFWEIHYPPKSAVPQPDENKIEDIPEIPREISTIDGDITPPIVDSSGEEDNSQVAAIPRESTPKKQPLPSQKDDKIDSETENCGFETPTEVD